MSKLPSISGRECVAALNRAGFYERRQSGSHIILQRDEPKTMIVVPDHKELDRGTLRAIIRQTGLTVDEFLELLND
jgi:predicted RNA binding protein YcfA (HicA-like mRNA interferase family)